MRKSGLSLAVALLVCGGSAFAQENTNATKVDEITVVSATGFEQNIVDAPASISVITSEEIEKSSYRDIKDVLKNTAGVNVHSFENKGSVGISIRGMDSKYTMILINGKPVSASEIGGDYISALNIQALPPLSMIERIEVIRGPMSSLYGSEAVGGVINVITKKVSNEWKASLSGQYNAYQARNFKSHYNTGFYLAGPLVKDVLGIEFNGLFGKKNEDERKYKDIVQPLSSGRKNIDFGGKISWLITSKDTMSSEYQYSRYKIFSNIWNYEENYKKDAFILNHEGNYDELRLQSYLKYDKSGFHGPFDLDDPWNFGRDMDTLIFNAQGTYNFDKHVLTLGFNYLSEKLSTILGDKSNRWNIALFGEDDYYIADNLILTLGARLNKDERYGLHFSPRAYAVYHINNHFTLKGGISTGYISPELLPSTQDSINLYSAGAGVEIGNSNIKPETSTNYEIGFSYNDEKMNFSLISFYSDFKDRIGGSDICQDGDYDDELTWTCELDGRKFWIITKSDNLDALYSAGIELSFDYQILDNLNLKTNYTYIKSKYKKGEAKGKITYQFPEHTINLGLNYQPLNSLNIWTNISYKHKEKDRVRRWDIAFGAPSFTTVDAGFVYKVNKNLSLNAGVYNLFDENPSYLDQEGAWGGDIVEFVERRKFMFGFNANF